MIYMRLMTNFIAGLLLTGILALAPATSFAHGGGGGGGGHFGGGGGGHFGGVMAGLSAADSVLWDMRSTDPSRSGGVILVRGIMMAVGRIIRTLGTTDITVHWITGSITMPARTMTIATPSMCSRSRVM
jgi:hypothetical protein